MKDKQIDAEIQEYLNVYKVDLPDEDEIEHSISYILSHVQPAESRIQTLQNASRSLLSNSFRELMHFGAMFWILNAIFLILGAITLIERNIDPYLTAVILAPLPFITGIYEIFKSRDEGLVELEMSLKYNTHQVFLSRLLTVGVFNLVLNTVLCALFASFYPQLLITKLLLCWTVPYVIVTAIAFLFAMNVKSSMASGILAATWLAFCYGFMQIEELQSMVMAMNAIPAAGILLTGILLWVIAIWQMKNNMTGRENYEA